MPETYDVIVIGTGAGGVWLFIHIGFLAGYRNRVGAMLGWWFAFTRDLRRERTFTIDDMPAVVGAPYGQGPASLEREPGLLPATSFCSPDRI